VDVNVKDDGGMAPLHYAARDGQKEIAELLIAEDAGVNAKANDGTTPLDWAVAWDEPEIADLLRKHGGKRGVKN
jgi:ankyrin repeat protein